VDQEITGEQVRAARSKLGISQERMAYELGASVTTVNRWENGRTHVTHAYRKILSAYFARRLGQDWRELSEGGKR
jgi:DNA-binding transcriptional regulator YiaG